MATDDIPPAMQQPALDSPDPDTRRIAAQAWVLSRPDALHEIASLLKDDDAAVRAHARQLWNAALSGGREADPP